MNTLTQTRISGVSLGARLSALRADFDKRWAQYKVYRTTLAELEALTERDLADLGIARVMIKDIALEAAYGK